MNLRQPFRNLPIRYKLLFSYASIFIFTLALGGFITHSVLKKTVEANIESELQKSTTAILNMVRTSVSVSIKNYLRAVAEKNLDMVRYQYSRYQAGELTEARARQLAEAMLLSQKIGQTGYIAAVNSQGVMALHPEKAWLGVDISGQAFIQEMIARKDGYLEYDWKNPGEHQPRPKALYMVYFEPWDWIIDVSSYRDEFSTLVNIDDFRRNLLSLRFGKTGYSFVVDSSGKLIIHPRLQGVNILQQTEMPLDPVKTMLETKSGKLVYTWSNPGENRDRQKIVIYNYIKEYDWIVASSSYLNEFYSPLETVNHVIIFTVFASLLLVLPISSFIGASLSNPLGELINSLEKGTTGDFSVRVTRISHDEIGRLVHYFNDFMDKLESYSQDLEDEVHVRRLAEEALRISEERTRSVMEAAPDPIIVYDMEGRVTYLNREFTRVFGWSLGECTGKKMDHFVPADNWEETRRGLKTITAGRSLSSVDTRRYTKGGELIDVSIRGAVYKDRDGKPSGSVIIHRDVSDLYRLEREVMDIGDRERQKIGQDLHDDLCPHLIGIEGLGKVLYQKLSSAQSGEKKLVEKITQLLKEAVNKSRRLARGLCPVYLVDHGLESSLREFAVNTEAMFGITCNFRCDIPVLVGDNIVATHIFHIVQEAVHNAIRHGKADMIDLLLQTMEGSTAITVTDNGRGIPKVIETDGMGLRIMGFRAKMINALLDIRSDAGGGTVVQLVLGGNTKTADSPNIP
ncbi:MAG: PAS domain S-box protein [Desulfobacterales bacterium]|nr:PAS domain S-box protein [Desulfobacterales bacterium]